MPLRVISFNRYWMPMPSLPFRRLSSPPWTEERSPPSSCAPNLTCCHLQKQSQAFQWVPPHKTRPHDSFISSLPSLVANLRDHAHGQQVDFTVSGTTYSKLFLSNGAVTFCFLTSQLNPFVQPTAEFLKHVISLPSQSSLHVLLPTWPAS